MIRSGAFIQNHREWVKCLPFFYTAVGKKKKTLAKEKTWQLGVVTLQAEFTSAVRVAGWKERA